MRLAASAHYVPEITIPLADCVAAAGGNRIESIAFERLFGISCAATVANTGEFKEALLGVVTRLGELLHQEPIVPDTLIYVHGNPVQPAMGVHEIQNHHSFLQNITRYFEMDQQNCSTLFWALGAAQSMLQAGLSDSVLVLAGDTHANLPQEERYAPGCTFIGDAIFGAVLDNRSDGTQIEALSLKTHPEYHFGRFSSTENTRKFNASHNGLVADVLGRLSFDMAGNEPVLPHNVNRLSWSDFARSAHMSKDRFWLDLLPNIGHCYTVDAFLMIDRLQRTPEVSSAALLSVALGGYVGGCRIRKSRPQLQEASHAHH